MLFSVAKGVRHPGAEYFVELSVCHPERSAAESKDLRHEPRITSDDFYCIRPSFMPIIRIERETAPQSGNNTRYPSSEVELLRRTDKTIWRELWVLVVWAHNWG